MVTLTYEQCQKLFNMNAFLTQSLNEREVLQNLMSAAMDLVKRADTILIYEWNEAGWLAFSEGIGVDRQAIKKVKFRSGESITGRAFQEKQIYNITLDTANDLMKNMSAENAAAFQQAVYFREVQSVLATPLIYQDTCFGVLVVDNFDAQGDVFTEEETLIIEILANQAAIALINSRLYRELEQRNNDLLVIQQIHEKFSKILLEGRGIDQIVHMLNRILSLPVTYCENLSDSNPVYPIISYNETLGYFQLPRPFEDYSNLEKVAIEQASNAVVIELIKQNNLFERENKLTEELFVKLLDGSLDERPTGYSKFDRLSEYHTVSVVLIEGRKHPLWLNDSLLSKERSLRKLKIALYQAEENVIVFNRGFTVLVLIPLLSARLHKKLKDIVHTIFSESEAVIGIGRKVQLGRIADSYREANEALQLAKKSKEKQIIRYEDLGFERLWHGMDPEALTRYVHDQLGPLLHGDPLDFETLQTYIELNASHKISAEKLCIHPNTLTYRLRKIEEILSVDLRSKKDLLKLMTAFDILNFLPQRIVENTK